MTHRLPSLRRFRFNRPQRIAAGLLALFLLQGFWIVSRQTLTDRDLQYARCGRETWEKPLLLAGQYASCGNMRDGILAYRLAGLPLALHLLDERGLDRLPQPDNRVAQTGAPADRSPSAGRERFGGDLNTGELRQSAASILFLLRLPFLLTGFLLGGCIWWVTRRLYGNQGGYTALALYCFSPAVLRACVAPNAEALAALGLYGSAYTCIGVAHAMQGPVAKWRPRILLLTAILGTAAAAHIVALPLALLLGLAAMLWVAEGHWIQVLPVVLAAAVGALLIVFACYGFSPHAASDVFRSGAGFLRFSLDPALRFFGTHSNAGISLAVLAAVLLYLSARRSRYFGNTAPLLCASVCMALVMTGPPGSPWLWAQPFLLTFVGGVFADAYESPRGRWAQAAAAAVVALQAVLCIVSLPGLA